MHGNVFERFCLCLKTQKTDANTACQFTTKVKRDLTALEIFSLGAYELGSNEKRMHVFVKL